MTPRDAILILRRDALDRGLTDLVPLYEASAILLGWEEIIGTLSESVRRIEQGPTSA